jgi:glutathione-regulated potassium-efflux system ancillary protein KefC
MHEERGLLLDAVLYLGATVVFVPLAKRLGLGSVLGYLAAGCAIGPFGLGLVSNVESIMHFAEFGVVLMLFAIGLELDPKRLWSMRRDVFQGGALQMALCAAPIGVLFLALGLPWRAALTASLALALSSTAIAVQSMNERNLLATPIGRVSFAILLFQDIAAIPLIGLVPLLAADAPGAGDQSWLGALRVLLAIAAVVVIGRFLTRPILRIVARTGLREVFTAFALLVVAGIAQLMALAEVSMALGAFLAGVLLAGSEYRHALETDIEPFKGLLLGLFFIAVGMSIDFGLLARSPLAIAGLCAALLVFKGLALALLAGRLGVAARQRWLLAALLAQGGEFAFVLLGVARAARVLPGEWDARLTLVVALSMALTPLLLLLHDKAAARRAARQSVEYDAIAADDAPVLIAGFGRFGQIVGRLLYASGVRATVLDHDPDQIELLRKFGLRVFYGDATRVDLLHAAGASRARLLVNAIDDVEDSLHLCDDVREHFPHLTIVARARNVTHYLELRERGIALVERETFEAALSSGRAALEALGVDRYEARERADRFRRHNLRSLEQTLPHYKDETSRLSSAKAAREELDQQFQRDVAVLERQGKAGWHEELEAADDERASRLSG